jgi:enterochelin esterase-like enzyme
VRSAQVWSIRAIPLSAAALVLTLTAGCDSGTPHAAAAGSTSPSASSAFSNPSAIGPGSWTTLRVPAAAVAGGHRTVLVYTPAVARPEQLPVLYLLHGEPGRPTDLCTPAVGIALDATFRSGVRPFVLACPDGNDGDFADTEWADSTDGRSQVEAFVTGPLIAAVEGSHVRPRSERAIAGFSMGGYGAAMLALRHSDLYSQVATLAGYFTIDDPDKVFGADPGVEAAYDPTDLVSTASRLRWLLIEASTDDEPLTAHASQAYAALLQAHGVPVDLRVTAGGHDGDWARAQLPAVARFLSTGWAAP